MKESAIAQQKKIHSLENTFNHRNGSFIHKSGEEIFLEHRLKNFLTKLIDHKNKVVTKSELLESVWKDVIVSEESLMKAASDLRKFFAINNITDYRLITIRKLGYKLEIIEPELRKTSIVSHLLRTGGYVILAFFLIIIIIRAINY